MAQKQKKQPAVFKEAVYIAGFIKSMNEKDYAKANKCLRGAVEEKIKSRIRQFANISAF